jgi:hypothetical protein
MPSRLTISNCNVKVSCGHAPRLRNALFYPVFVSLAARSRERHERWFGGCWLIANPGLLVE